MSSFATNHVQSLVLRTSSDVENIASENRDSQETEALYSLLAKLKQPLDNVVLKSTLEELATIEDASVEPSSNEKNTLQGILENKILVSLYAQALDLCLKEATEADSEAQWWEDIGRSWQSVAWYFLATLPGRLGHSFKAILRELRSRNVPLRLSSLTPQSLRLMFSRSPYPITFASTLFPHISHRSRLPFASPIELTRRECLLNQRKLIELRNKRAQTLGQILSLKSAFEVSLSNGSGVTGVTLVFRKTLIDMDTIPAASLNTLALLRTLAFTDLSTHALAHDRVFNKLRRPSRLTMTWPSLVLFPPVAYACFRLFLRSQQSIVHTAIDAYNTCKSFWFNYIIEPVTGILDTVRAGGDNYARIVSREAVRADLESLERMALSMGRDKLGLDDNQLRNLSTQVHEGDLTSILQIYEEDIKSPIRSAVSGTLVRSLLIQVQKAKVDLDQALSGIDKLLKSQELTFAFVGVAPSLTIVYVAFNYLRNLWVGGRGSKRYGGRRARERTWLAYRRIERLLISSTDNSIGAIPDDTSTLPHVTLGLMLISVSHLRVYAETYLPLRSLLREGFLEDVADLENPELSRAEKRRVLERMWRSWGCPLGWHKLGSLSI